MRILAVGAHPDDVEAHCGGTVAKFALRGDQVFACACTDGSLGHQVIPPEKLVPIRRREAQEAAAVLGARLRLLGEPDGWLFADPRTLGLMLEVFAWAQPEVVLTHFPQDYHPDHRACSQLVQAACALVRTGGPRGTLHRPLLLYMDAQETTGFSPHFYVDLSGAPLERKLAALACHRSQVEWIRHHDGVDLLDWFRSAARMRGLQCGVEFAEALALGDGGGMIRPEAVLP